MGPMSRLLADGLKNHWFLHVSPKVLASPRFFSNPFFDPLVDRTYAPGGPSFAGLEPFSEELL